jgi:hypothetical protein
MAPKNTHGYYTAPHTTRSAVCNATFKDCVPVQSAPTFDIDIERRTYQGCNHSDKYSLHTVLLSTALSLAKNAMKRPEYPIPSRSRRYLCRQCSPRGTECEKRWCLRSSSRPPGYDLPCDVDFTNAVSMISLLSAWAGTMVVMNPLCELELKGSACTIVRFPDTLPCVMRRNLRCR